MSEALVRGVDYPEWLLADGLSTLQKGYLLEGETPKAAYWRMANAAAKWLKKPEFAQKAFDSMWAGYLCPATPVFSNFGAERGLPISCFASHFGDSVLSIFDGYRELAMFSKNGGGVGTYWGDVRSRGNSIRGNGRSEGIIPWLKILDSTTIGVSQGSTRRGASVAYLDVDHGDIEEFIQMRKPTAEPHRQCLNIHHAINITDDFMNRVKSGDENARKIWREILKTRFETGEPYLTFIDSANAQAPLCYKEQDLKIRTSQLCNEIYLHTDTEHSFVCCLSSLNLVRYHEWKNTDLVQTAIYFLDAVMEEFIQKASLIPGFEKAVRFAEKSRALGLGVLGWHSLLQQEMVPFESYRAMQLNNEIFKGIQAEAEKATAALAAEYGEPLWCKGYARRNTHLLAIAPTASNSIISGSVSAGIEPLSANAYALKTAKGTFFRRNPQLEALLETKGKNTPEFWNDIVVNEGSVQHLKYLSTEEKEVFLTAREISQVAIVQQAAQRQKYIDQGQSVNLFFPVNASAKYVNKVHTLAHELGLKGLYYCRTGSVLKGDAATRQNENECKACEG